MTWKTVIVAQSNESKFFLSQIPVTGEQNIHPNSCRNSDVRFELSVTYLYKVLHLYYSIYLYMYAFISFFYNLHAENAVQKHINVKRLEN